MSHMPRRCVAALILLLGVAPGTAAAKPTRCTARLSATQVAVGGAAKLRGRVTPHAARRVRLELRQGKRWTVSARKRSARSGRFSFALPTGAAATLVLRVTVPKTKTAKGATCRALTL